MTPQISKMGQYEVSWRDILPNDDVQNRRCNHHWRECLTPCTSVGSSSGARERLEIFVSHFKKKPFPKPLTFLSYVLSYT